MAGDNIWKALILIDEAKANAILDEAFRRYFNTLSNIASDIYDSCIEDYYAQYEPIKYTRHGDIKGFNLYSANAIQFDEASYNLSLDFDPNRLMSYYDGKKSREKRDKVLKSVMAGFRGTKSRKTPAGWPQPWRTSYPNQYSQYTLWSSTGRTMDAIYEDFMENVREDTKHLLNNYIKNLL